MDQQPTSPVSSNEGYATKNSGKPPCRNHTRAYGVGNDRCNDAISDVVSDAVSNNNIRNFPADTTSSGSNLRSSSCSGSSSRFGKGSHGGSRLGGPSRGAPQSRGTPKPSATRALNTQGARFPGGHPKYSNPCCSCSRTSKCCKGLTAQNKDGKAALQGYPCYHRGQPCTRCNCNRCTNHYTKQTPQPQARKAPAAANLMLQYLLKDTPSSSGTTPTPGAPAPKGQNPPALGTPNSDLEYDDESEDKRPPAAAVALSSTSTAAASSSSHRHDRMGAQLATAPPTAAATATNKDSPRTVSASAPTSVLQDHGVDPPRDDIFLPPGAPCLDLRQPPRPAPGGAPWRLPRLSRSPIF